MILGIDYGLKNIGLAVAEGEIAEPKESLLVSSQKSVVSAVERRLKDWGITKIVVGVSEGKSGERARGFGRKLQSVLHLPVEFCDETLTTAEANQSKSKPKKRGDRDWEHAKAAAIILQRYLDQTGK